MRRPKKIHPLPLPLLFFLLPPLFFITTVDFSRNIQDAQGCPAPPAGGAPAEDEGSTPLISEQLLLCPLPLAPSKAKPPRLWRQLLIGTAPTSLLSALGTVRRARSSRAPAAPLRFFQILLISLLLGGRAPPRPLLLGRRLCTVCAAPGHGRSLLL